MQALCTYGPFRALSAGARLFLVRVIRAVRAMVNAVSLQTCRDGLLLKRLKKTKMRRSYSATHFALCAQHIPSQQNAFITFATCSFRRSIHCASCARYFSPASRRVKMLNAIHEFDALSGGSARNSAKPSSIATCKLQKA